MFQWVTSPSYLSKGLRAILVPYILPLIVRYSNIAPQLYGRTAQLAISYEACDLSVDAGVAQEADTSALKAGQRLPWLENVTTSDSLETLATNFDTLKSIQWQGHVFGEADWARQVLRTRDVVYHSFTFTEEARERGFPKDVLYLIQPDGHIGYTSNKRSSEGAEVLAAYLRKWVVTPL